MSVRQWLRGLCLGAAAALLALAAGQGYGANKEVSEARMRRDIFFLASDECEGRGPGTKGINKAADYIANEFKKAGLKPGGKDGSYFQPFTISAGAGKLTGRGSLTLRGPQGQVIHLKPGVDFEVTGGSGGGKADAPLVFAGFGVVGPQVKYDDYKGLDVAGKIVVLIRRVPRWDSKETPFGGSEQNKMGLAALLPKFAQAEAHRAAAVLLVNDFSDEKNGDKLNDFEALSGAGGVSIPVLHVHRSVLDPVLRSSLGEGLTDLENDISRDLKPRGAPLRGWSARLTAPVERTTFALKNVIGVLEGAGPLAKETVVVGAHYDHLGYGGYGSLAKDRTKKQIDHGADDNGSGTTTVMELARRFAEIKNRQGRRLVFMTFSGEERGLLGSIHYCNNPLFPLESTVAMINLDMVGRLPEADKKLIVEGVQAGKGFDELIARFNKKYGFQLTKKSGGSGYSDHASFYRKKVPVMFLWTGTHADYHRPSDTADKINVPGMRRIADLAEDLLAYFATVEERPEYTAIKGGGGSGPVRGKGPTLGIVPQYDDAPNAPKGLLVSQVIDGRPAAKAGVKAGDLIVEIGGRQISNIATYMAVMGAQQPGSTIDVAVMRRGERVKLKVSLK